MSEARAATPSPWIVSAWFDTAFFLATPLLPLALLLPLTGRWSSMEIYLAVMTFSSFGHHLPGFLRAYGDAALFRHFRWRFLLAPPLLYAVFYWFASNNWRGMIFLLALWSIWHVMMQHFGFMRIYDAKVGATKKSDALWDRAVSLSWFASIVLWSPQYTHNLLDGFYQSGGPLISLGVVETLRFVVWGATALVTLGYLGYAAGRIARKEPLSRLKIVLLVVTISFLGYVWVGLQDIILGLAIWEIFHDIQYFAITWIYNRRLVEKGLGDTRFMNFLFRRKGPLVALYVGAIAAYGSLNWFAVGGDPTQAAAPILALIFTSTILHYYFDGFIWKVREDRTREGLNLEGEAEPRGVLSTSMRSALVQVLGFAIPIGTLAAMESRKPEVRDEVAIREAIRGAAPNAIESHLNVGLAYSEAGQADAALASYRRATEISPDDPRAIGGYATALLEARGAEGAEEAERELLRAIELAPENSAHAANLAILYFGQGRTEESLEVFRKFSSDPEWRPRTPTELLLSGLTALQEGQLEVACIRLEETLRFEPDNQDALQALAFASRSLGRPEVTLAVFERLLELTPDRVAIRLVYADCLLGAGEFQRAVPQLEMLIQVVPEDYDRKLQLAEVLATCSDPAARNGQRAVELAREVVEFTKEDNVGALDILGAALAETGEFGGALTYSAKALELAQARGMQANAEAITARRELYLLGKPFHIEAPQRDAQR